MITAPLRLAALALVACSSTKPVVGACGKWPHGQTVKVITTPDAELPPDGGIVVAATPDTSGRHDDAIQRSWRFKGGTRSRVRVDFGSLPADVIVVVLADEAGKSREFRLTSNVWPGSSKLQETSTTFESHSCAALPNGVVASKAGDVVTVRFVDDLGRVSPPSKPYQIDPASP